MIHLFCGSSDAQKHSEDFADFYCDRYSAERVGICCSSAYRLLNSLHGSRFREFSMSHLFLTKELDGYAVTFLRFDGPERFIVQVNGVERTISRDVWMALPERPLTEHDKPGLSARS